MDAPTAVETRLSKAQKGVLILMVFSVFINYIDRIALSVAARPIVAEFGFSPVSPLDASSAPRR